MVFALRKLRGAGIGAGANLRWVSIGIALFLLSCGEDGGAGSAGASVAERLQEASTLPPVDYLNLDLWGCHPGKASDECTRPYRIERIEADGSAREEVPLRDDPARLDCFFTYPTVDWSPKAGNHEDLTDVLIPALTIRALAGRFSEVCRVFAPFYRQGTLGSYMIPPEEGAAIFRAAFADVAAAFETYLREWNNGRPIVVIGHSQGAQMASYLLHRYFDGSKEVTRVPGRRRSDELRAALVLALPIGFNTYVLPGERVGGSFSDLPLCTDAPERGCVLHYRSHADGDNPKPGSAGGGGGCGSRARGLPPSSRGWRARRGGLHESRPGRAAPRPRRGEHKGRVRGAGRRACP
ncbi:MAG: DUF3089 domain-containing protein [Nitrospirae bacterium]|nr:DUF3089 domain-containing protein [Nitrospirota bacterium]